MEKIKFEKREHEPFYIEMRSRVEQHLAENNLSRFANGTAWVKFWVYVAIIVSSYGLLVSGLVGNLLGLQIIAIVFGASVLLLAFNAGHDAAHQCFSKNKFVNQLIYTINFALLGVSGYLWQYRHNRSHHVFPNVDGCDIDIDENPFVRLSPHHQRRWYQRFQFIYAPLVYWLVSLDIILIQDFMYLTKKSLANMHNIKHAKREYFIFAGVKLFYFVTILLIPYLALDIGFWHFLIGYLVMNFVISVMFIMLLIGTHFAEENEFPELGQDNTLKGSWARHALDTSLDWSPKSRVANYIVGGANCHAAHHLFPGICHIHYLEITEIIRNTLEKHGMKYKETTLLRMAKSHFSFLKTLSHQKKLLVGIA